MRSEATSERMKVVVDTFKRKKAAMHLDERQSAMLENAYYQVRVHFRTLRALLELTSE